MLVGVPCVEMEKMSIADNKKIRNFFIRLAVFVLITLAVLAYAAFVLVPKYDYGICSMANLYAQPKDSVDVLAVGTSQTYGSINTSILWEEYGIASYSLATAEQTYWVAYYQLTEALKMQSPKLVILDAKTCTYPADANNMARTVMGTFGIFSPSTRIQAIKACTMDTDVLSYVMAFPQIHRYYSVINEDSWKIPVSCAGRSTSWKGYIEQTETEKHERPSLVWTSTKKPVNEREEEYFRKIIELCSEEEIPVLLVSYPYPDYANDHMYVNSLFEIADEYGIACINYNNPDLRFGLRYSSDFSDWQHLNVKGSTNFSYQLGADIKELFDIPDRRGDSYYSSYETCASEWFEKYPEYLPE